MMMSTFIYVYKITLDAEKGQPGQDRYDRWLIGEYVERRSSELVPDTILFTQRSSQISPILSTRWRLFNVVEQRAKCEDNPETDLINFDHESLVQSSEQVATRGVLMLVRGTIQAKFRAKLPDLDSPQGDSLWPF